MSNYPGNNSLASAVKERVNSTFQQAIVLYRQGRTDEVVAGCNLILQMDPLFDPAKRLLEKVKNPAAAVDVDSLATGSSATAALSDARAAMAARDFERVIQLTTDILTNDLMNEEARVMADEAREKVEAAPFIEQFVRKCEQSVNNGNLPAARTDLEKARALGVLARARDGVPGAERTARQHVLPAGDHGRSGSQRRLRASCDSHRLSSASCLRSSGMRTVSVSRK